jgi:hypothetical protein
VAVPFVFSVASLANPIAGYSQDAATILLLLEGEGWDEGEGGEKIHEVQYGQWPFVVLQLAL